MNIARLVVGAVLASTALAACSAPTVDDFEAKLKTATLQATGSAETAAIVISKHDANSVRVTWDATVDGKAFICDADNLVRLPACAPADQPGALRP